MTGFTRADGRYHDHTLSEGVNVAPADDLSCTANHQSVIDTTCYACAGGATLRQLRMAYTGASDVLTALSSFDAVTVSGNADFYESVAIEIADGETLEVLARFEPVQLGDELVFGDALTGQLPSTLRVSVFRLPESVQASGTQDRKGGKTSMGMVCLFVSSRFVCFF
jgi:hypothetical protein